MATDDAGERTSKAAASGSQKRFADLATTLEVGTISALAIENGPFGVEDIANRDVSYVMLRDAGVSPLDADRLRRRYSLTWTFVWTEGAHLLQRAEQLRTLRETERAWIAASTTAARKQEHRARRRWREMRETTDETRPLDADGDSPSQPRTRPDESTGRCPRCGDSLFRYTLGRCESVTCESCGFARLDTAHTVESPGNGTNANGAALSWEESVRQFVAED